MRQNLKILVAAAIVLGLIVAGFFFYKFGGHGNARPKISLEKMGQFVSLKMNYTENIEFNNTKSIGVIGTKGIVYGGTKILLVIRGECTISTDMTRARISRPAAMSGDSAGNETVEISLPMPAPLLARINHDAPQKGGTYIASINNNGIQAILPGGAGSTAAINQAMTTAQDRVKLACSRPEIIESARQNAETVLGALFVANHENPVFHWN